MDSSAPVPGIVYLIKRPTTSIFINTIILTYFFGIYQLKYSSGQYLMRNE